MAVSLKHKFQSAKADSGDASIVRPSNWNDEHDLTLAASRLLGRYSGSAGSAQEISLGTGLQFNASALETKLRGEVVKTADYNLVAVDSFNYINMNKAATAATVGLPALAGTLNETYIVRNSANIPAIIDGNGAEPIEGQLTISLPKGATAILWPNAGKSAWNAIISYPDYGGGADFLKGLITTKSSAYVVSVAAGVIKGNGRFVSNTSAFTKNLNAAWAAGSGNGGRMSAAALAANTTYHLHALQKDSDGSFDCGFDVSATAPTVPAGYTWVGRFDWCYTNTTPNAIVDYTQVGNDKYFAGTLWFSSASTLADALYTLPVSVPCPTGVRTAVTMLLSLTSNSGGTTATSINDADANLGNYGPVFQQAQASGSAVVNGSGGKCKTNTSRQLKVYSTVAGTGGSATVYVSGIEDFTLNRIN